MSYKEWEAQLPKPEPVPEKKAVAKEAPKEKPVDYIDKLKEDIVKADNDRIEHFGLTYEPIKTGMVNLDKMDKRLAEPIARQLDKLTNEYYTGLVSVQVGRVDNALTYAQTHNCGHGALISFSHKFTSYDRYISIIRKDRSNVHAHDENEILTTATHEFAHTIFSFDNKVKNDYGMDESINRGFRKEIKGLFEEYKDTIDSAKLSIQEKADIKISDYAHTKIGEFMAEAFTDAKLNDNPSEYSKRTLEVIDRYFNKDNIASESGLGSGKGTTIDILDKRGDNNEPKVGDVWKNTEGEIITEIKDIVELDINDEKAVQKALNDFADKYADVDHEYSLEISPNGNAYYLEGTRSKIYPEIISEKNLVGSIGIHNHPIDEIERIYGKGDSFSRDDLKNALQYKKGKQYLISGTRREVFEFVKEYNYNDVKGEWRNALNIVRGQRQASETEIIFENEETLRELQKIWKGLKISENF